MQQLIGNERARRSSRVLVSLALAVSGQKSDGSHVSGSAETILVNRHGAKIRSTVPLEPKMEVRVAMLAPYKWRVGQVVWADSGEREYGIELYRPENFWGIYFPPQDDTQRYRQQRHSISGAQPDSSRRRPSRYHADWPAGRFGLHFECDLQQELCGRCGSHRCLSQSRI